MAVGHQRGIRRMRQRPRALLLDALGHSHHAAHRRGVLLAAAAADLHVLSHRAGIRGVIKRDLVVSRSFDL